MIILEKLPIKADLSMSAIEAAEFGKNLSSKYLNASPFPHIVIDNFLPEKVIQRIHKEFPLSGAVKNKTQDYEGVQKLKFQYTPDSLSQFNRRVFEFFNSASFLRFLEELTGIDALIPDVYFDGAGFHETKAGGMLSIHADFRVNNKLHLLRRINVLIYLNPEWNSLYGGNLELWNSRVTKKVKSIEPIFNRCVIFNTDADSYHGHPDPLNTPEGITRKSIALYYYTASKSIYNEVAAFSTMPRARPNDKFHLKKFSMKLRIQNIYRDLLPPILIRNLGALKRKVMGKIR